MRDNPTTDVGSGLVAEPGRVEVQGRRRTSVVVRRERTVPGAAIVLALHGSNQDGRTLRRFAGYGFDRFAADHGAVVAYLDGYRKNWNDARRESNFAARRDGIDDVAFVEAAIAQLSDAFGADPARVFVIGFSAGGAMVLRLLHEMPRRLSGAAVVSATQPVPENFLDLRAETVPVPVVFFHGTADRLVPYAGGMASLWGFRPRGLGRSAPDTAAYYADRNGITAPPTTTALPRSASGDTTSIERTEYRQVGHAPVTLYSVRGGGHAVPGPKNAPRIMGRTTGRLDAAAVIADFFGLAAAARRDSSTP